MDLLKKVTVAVFFCLSLIIFLRVLFLGTYPDFIVYYFGSQSFLLGENPYIAQSNLFSNYVYPPFVLLLFLPYTLLPIYVASISFVSFSIISLFLGVYFCLQAIKSFTITRYLVIVSFCMISFPVKFTLGMGQINLVLFLLLSLGFYLLTRKKQKTAGVFFGVSLATKLFPFLLLPYFFIQKQWKTLIFSIITISLLYSITVLLTGIGLQRFYLQNVLPGIGSSYQNAYYNQAISGFFARLPIEREVGLLLKTATSVIFIAASFLLLFKTRRDKKLQNMSLTFVITLSLLVNPFSWQHHFVWLIIPYIVTYFTIKSRDKVLLFLLVVSYVLVSLNFSTPEALPTLFQSHVLFGTVLLWLVQARILLTKK